jgi:hypothetical protein
MIIIIIIIIIIKYKVQIQFIRIFEKLQKTKMKGTMANTQLLQSLL